MGDENDHGDAFASPRRPTGADASPLAQLAAGLRRASHAWFDLNADEQRAILLVLALALLGLAARWWHMAHREELARAVPAALAPVGPRTNAPPQRWKRAEERGGGARERDPRKREIPVSPR